MTTIIVCVVVSIVFLALYLFVRGAAKANRQEEMVYQNVPEVNVPEVEFEEIESNQKPITVGDVYLYFKGNGYLKECQKGNYKFSASRLKVLIKNEELHGVDINHPEAATIVNGVGEKVYDLIKHLVTKYKEENAINP